MSKYNVTEFRDEIVLYTDTRIKKDERRSDVNYYDIRHDDEEWLPCTIENGVWVNHFGTIISNNKLDMDVKDNWNGTRYIDLSEDEKEEFTFDSAERITLDEYITQFSNPIVYNIFIGLPTINIKGKDYKVRIFSRDRYLYDNSAYIFNDIVLPFKGKLRENIGEVLEAGLYQHNEHLLMIPPESSERRLYNIKNIEGDKDEKI